MTNHPLTCKEILQQINLLIDGELEAELCDQLEKHLRECDNCRVVVNTTTKTIELYQEIRGQDQLPEDVRKRLYLRLNLPEPGRDL